MHTIRRNLFTIKMETAPMTGINIYEIPALIQISPPAENNSDSYRDGVSRAMGFFKTDMSVNNTPVRAVAFKDQYIEPRWGFVFESPENYIQQSAYLKPETLLRDIADRNLSEAITLPEGNTYFMAYNHDYANYYHWTLQCLPSLCLFAALKNLNSDLKLLLPSNLPGFAKQYLDMLGIDMGADVQLLPLQDRLFFAKQLLYPSFLGGEFSFNVSPVMLEYLDCLYKRKIGSNAHNVENSGKKRILYCARLDSSNRRIINEPDVINFLEANFEAEIFLSTGKSVAEQAQKFNSADILISPHGAGMSNLVFCKPGVTIIEIMPDKYINPCFATLALAKGCNYHPFSFPTRTFDGHQHNYEWEIDISQLKDILSKNID